MRPRLCAPQSTDATMSAGVVDVLYIASVRLRWGVGRYLPKPRPAPPINAVTLELPANRGKFNLCRGSMDKAAQDISLRFIDMLAYGGIQYAAALAVLSAPAAQHVVGHAKALGRARTELIRPPSGRRSLGCIEGFAKLSTRPRLSGDLVVDGFPAFEAPAPRLPEPRPRTRRRVRLSLSATVQGARAVRLPTQMSSEAAADSSFDRSCIGQ